MRFPREWLHSRWRVPVVSGLMIIASLVAPRLSGVAWLGDLLMVSPR